MLQLPKNMMLGRDDIISALLCSLKVPSIDGEHQADIQVVIMKLARKEKERDTAETGASRCSSALSWMDFNVQARFSDNNQALLAAAIHHHILGLRPEYII